MNSRSKIDGIQEAGPPSDASHLQESLNETPAYIKLDQFLKLVGVVSTGGQAKWLIQDGMVQVNGEVETRRGRKLVTGDQVAIDDEIFSVTLQ